MLTIARLGGGGQAADYYLDRAAECEEPEHGHDPSEYYMADPETTGRWIGGGASAAGLVGALGADGGRALRLLLDGRGPDGTSLVAPVLRADPRSEVSARVLVRAVEGRAEVAGASAAALFADPADGDAFIRAVAAVARDDRAPLRPRATVPAELAGRLCAAVGLDPPLVYAGDRGGDVFGAALARAGERVDVRRAGLDLTFSAPKSVSVLFGLGDERVAGEVRAAHRAAVEQTITYLEGLAARAMRGHNEDGHPPRIATTGWRAAAFDHAASRSDDPQLHTHVVVPNVVQGVDGRWSAFDTREVYRQAQTGGYLYQAVLRGELTRRLGVRWSPVRRGVAELDGIPAELRRLFSTRRTQVEEMLERTGRSGPKAAQVAAWRSRSAKTHAPELTRREQWRARAADAGFDPAAVVAAATLPRQRDLRGASVARAVADRVLGPQGVTARRSTFDRRDLLRAICEHVPVGMAVTVDEVRALATRIIRDPRVVPLSLGGPAAHRRYSTVELLGTEQIAVWAAKARAGDGLARVRADEVDATGLALTAEQSEVVRRLVSSGAGVEVLVGPAGAGKTAALAAARELWEAEGVPVRGAAVAALAARNLEEGPGISSSSLTRLFRAIDRDGLTGALPGGVLVIDEASMVPTRMLAHLIDLTAQANVKLVLVGDPAQLPEIEAGGLFAALARSLPVARLSGNVRQRDTWERNALAELRDGDPLRALNAYRAHDRLHISDGTNEARSAVVDAYLAARAPGGDGSEADVIMLAGTRADARALNRLVRERLEQAGALAGPGMTVRSGGRTLDLHVGDAVLVTANDYGRGLFNGTRATVAGADEEQVTLRVPVAGTVSREVVLPRAVVAAGALEHGYALTCHRAQGITVDVALLYASRSLSREAGYVALSRGRIENRIFATWEALVPEIDHGVDGPREGRVARAERDELTRSALVQKLSTRTAQRLASEQLADRSRRPGLSALASPPRGPERDVLQR